ncbi:MAG: hypothetical protein ACSLFP_04615 [Acidimicrobiales bacterium]
MRTALVGVVTALGLVTGACGGDDGGGSDGGAIEAAAVEDVQACLQEAGLEVEDDDDLSDDLREAFGIEDALDLMGDGDLVGLGSVTWYESADKAEEAHEAGGAVRTDDVARAVVGRITYDFVGADKAQGATVGGLIEGCL